MEMMTDTVGASAIEAAEAEYLPRRSTPACWPEPTITSMRGLRSTDDVTPSCSRPCFGPWAFSDRASGC